MGETYACRIVVGRPVERRKLGRQRDRTIMLCQTEVRFLGGGRWLQIG